MNYQKNFLDNKIMELGARNNIKDNFFSLIVSSRFYESIEDYKPTSIYKDIAKSLLPDNWYIFKDRIFYNCTFSDFNYPLQGWKIHISSTNKDSSRILKKVVGVCIENSTPFKFICDSFLLGIVSDKHWPRGSSNKFITIYPSDEESFKKIINQLYEELKGFNGPYILSDKRYKDCKVLYYRYGGIISQDFLNHRGYKIPYLKSPKGDLIPDFRSPFYFLPDWVNDPFEDSTEKIENSSSNELTLNNGRYEVLEALSFSNSGGVYLAYDRTYRRKVIIKEARPYTVTTSFDNTDSVYLLKREWRNLNLLKDFKVAPQPIDCFDDWEHHFIVEEYIEGKNAQDFCASLNVLINPNPTEEELVDYYEKVIKVGINLAKAVRCAHNNNLIIGDLNPNNIIIKEDFSVYLIDLETAILNEKEESSNLYTIGFIDKVSLTKGGMGFHHDLFALGAILFHLLSATTTIIEIKPDFIRELLEELKRDFNLPEELKSIILSLMSSDLDKRPDTTCVIKKLESIGPLNKTDLLKNTNGQNIDLVSLEELEEVIEGVSRFITNTATLNKNNRLFPADPKMVNKLNISHGAFGVFYALKEITGTVPGKFLEWAFNEDINEDNYPPGLYTGLSGIAWVLNEIGNREEAINFLEKAKNHHLLYDEIDIYSGYTGYGLTNLYFWKETDEKRFLNEAIKVGDFIVRHMLENKQGGYWNYNKEEIYYGYPLGNSGKSLFLLYLYLATDDLKYLAAGEKSISYVLNNSVTYKNITTFSESDANTSFVLPYWLNGTSGIATTLLRYTVVTKKHYYFKKLNDILIDCSRKYTAYPGLYNGLAGLGNVLIDCYQFLGEQSYLERSHKTARGILLYKINTSQGIGFPGDGLYRMSNDYATGSAGIGLFLNRLLKNTSNFNFLIDELITEKFKIK